MEVLTSSPWKGNVRELANFIERAVILSQGEERRGANRRVSGLSFSQRFETGLYLP